MHSAALQRLLNSATMNDGDTRTRDQTRQGTVREALPNALFAVELAGGQRILARIAGTIQMRGTRINPGDLVTIEMSPYDTTRGRIVRRHDWPDR